MTSRAFENVGTRGLTLLETMVALVILGLTVLAILQVFGGSIRSAQTSAEWVQAVAYAEDALEGYKIDGIIRGPSNPEALAGGYARWIEAERWGHLLVRLTVVVRLPGGGEFRLSRLARAP